MSEFTARVERLTRMLDDMDYSPPVIEREIEFKMPSESVIDRDFEEVAYECAKRDLKLVRIQRSRLSPVSLREPRDASKHERKLKSLFDMAPVGKDTGVTRDP